MIVFLAGSRPATITLARTCHRCHFFPANLRPAIQPCPSNADHSCPPTSSTVAIDRAARFPSIDPSRSNPHSARSALAAPAAPTQLAVSSCGGFRTPALRVRGTVRHGPASETHICETSRYRVVFERPSYVTRWRRTGWLGRRDSNLCILESEFAKTLSPGGGTRTCASRIKGAPDRRLKPVEAG
jgi:hypothetical protein